MTGETQVFTGLNFEAAATKLGAIASDHLEGLHQEATSRIWTTPEERLGFAAERIGAIQDFSHSLNTLAREERRVANGYQLASPTIRFGNIAEIELTVSADETEGGQ